MSPNIKRIAAAVAAALAVTGVGVTAVNAESNEAQSEAASSSYDGKTSCASGDSKPSRRAIRVVGLTSDGRLVCFEERRPENARDIGTISGLAGDVSLVGIDYRPATGELIGLGNAGGLYSLDTNSARATKKSQLSVALSGTSFGVDFNPTVDRLRIVSDTGQNLRVNVTDGLATVDGPLTLTPPPASPVTATGVTGAAYTNNDADPNTATTLYDIDSTLDQVAIQAPPNAGILNPTGKLTVDSTVIIGADIYSTIRNGTAVDVRGFASLTVGTTSGFYKIHLATGKATALGTFASHNRIIGIAIPLDQD